MDEIYLEDTSDEAKTENQKLAREGQDEIDGDEVCEICFGTGEVDNPYFDEGANEWISDGTKPCVCKLKLD